MALWLRQSTIITGTFGPFLLNTDGVTLVTNLVGTGTNQTENPTTGIRISKNGNAFAARHAPVGASAYDAYGNYLIILDATDTNTLGDLRIQYVDSAHFCPVWEDYEVVPSNIYDSIVAGTAYLMVGNVTGSIGGVVGLTPSNLDVLVSSRMPTGSLGNLDVPVSSRLATGSLSNLDAPISSRQPTGTNFAGLIYLDVPISSRLPTGTLGYLDAFISSRMISGTVSVGDKSGFSLATPQSFDLIGNISGTLQGNINGYVGMVTGSAMSLVSGTSGGGGATAAQVWTYGIRQLTDPQNFNLIGNISGTLQGLTPSNLDVPISSRLASGTLFNLDVPISSRLPTGTLSNLDVPVSSRMPTGTSFANLSNLDVPVSSRQPTGTNFSALANLDAPISSRMPTGSLGNLDMPVSSRQPTGSVNVIGLTPSYLDVPVSSRLVSGSLIYLDVPISSRQPTGTNLANLSNLDVPVSSRMATGTSFANLANLDVPVSSRLATGSLGNLDVPISSRMATGTSVSLPTGVFWNYLDVPVSSRQPTGTNLAGLIYLDAPISSRMPTGSLGYLDVPVSSRMATGTITSSIPTGTNFANLANLDVPVSSRMPTGTSFSFSLPTGTVFYIPTGTVLVSYVTLGQPSVQMLAALQGAIINAVRHDTLVLQFSNLGSLAGRTKLYFTVKSSPDDDDTQSEIQIEESGGLLYIDQTVGTHSHGSLVVTDALLGNLTVTLDASEMSKLDIGKYTYDIKIIRGAGIPVTTLTMNVFNVVADSTWSVI